MRNQKKEYLIDIEDYFGSWYNIAVHQNFFFVVSRPRKDVYNAKFPLVFSPQCLSKFKPFLIKRILDGKYVGNLNKFYLMDVLSSKKTAFKNLDFHRNLIIQKLSLEYPHTSFEINWKGKKPIQLNFQGIY